MSDQPETRNRGAEAGPIRFEPGTGGTFTLTVEREGATESWSGILACCSDPTCGCTEVTLDLKPIQGPGVPVEVVLDVNGRGLAWGQHDPPPHALSRFVASHLPDAAWEWLARCFLAVKRAAIAAVNPEALDIEFPSNEIEIEGMMVGWQEVFPHSGSLVVSLDATEYIVDEQYCVQTGCGCRDVALTFFDTDNPETEHPPVCLLDYRSGWKRHPGSDDGLPESTLHLVQLLEEQERGARERFREHHQLLKRAYGAFSRRQQGTVGAAPNKAGRNDRCPCGSGRKYKKCCAAKGAAPDA